VQQARNLALTLGERFADIKFVIRDRGSNFTASFDAVFQATGTRILRTVLAEYQVHYNTARPHQGIAQRVPDEEPAAARATPTDIDRQQIRRKPVLERPDQRVHARRLTPKTCTSPTQILFSSGTGSEHPDVPQEHCGVRS
jgi:hypothetical protein